MYPYQDAALSVEDRVDDLFARMTLTERVGQLNQKLYGFQAYQKTSEGYEIAPDFCREVERWSGIGVLYGLFRADPWSKRTFENGILPKDAACVYNMMQRYVIEHSCLGIPMLMSSEAPHGHQALDGRLLPVNLACGCTFNPELIRRAAEGTGKELASQGVHLALVSMLDVLRDPRWGRCEECFSEDPYLAAEMAEAVVAGFQQQGVAVVAKHFAAQGQTTGGLNSSPAPIGEQELREIHLPPMEGAIRAGVKGCMAAYNEIDGVPCHANARLLDDILRKEMGFDGVVMADGTALDQLNALTGDPVQSAALGLTSGVDISLWDHAFECLAEAVESGIVAESKLETAVKRVLRLKFQLGLFDQPYVSEEAPVIADAEDALEIARQSVVLVKNTGNVLPLSIDSDLFVTGSNANSVYQQLGDYTSPQRPDSVTTVLMGLKRKWRGSVTYSPGCMMRAGTSEQLTEAAELASKADITVVVLGGSSARESDASMNAAGAFVGSAADNMDCGEGADVSILELPRAQIQLLRTLREQGKSVIAIVIGGRPYALEEVEELCDALLISFYPGPQGGSALAELLCGEVCPSGRLAVSIPSNTGQIPVFYNGKRVFNRSYIDGSGNALYPFGFGLTYGEYRYTSGMLSRTQCNQKEIVSGEVNVSCTIQNLSDRALDIPVQLYITALQGTCVPREKQLRGIQRVHLAPHTDICVRFKVDEVVLAQIDSRGSGRYIPKRTRLLIGENGVALLDCGVIQTE